MVDVIVSNVLQTLIDLAKDEVLLQLGGFEEELGKISSTFKAVRSLLEDAERREIQDESVRRWLQKLEDAANEMDDLLEEWMVKSHQTLHPAAGRGSRVSNLLPSSLTSKIKLMNLKRKYASQLCDINEKLDQIEKEKDRFQFNEIKMVERADRSTCSLVDEKSVMVRDGDKEILVKKLTGDNLDCVSVVSIVGMGGVGKTTLAQYVYNDQKVKDHFQRHLWICVSDDFDVREIVRKIVEVGGGNCSKVTELESRAKKLVEMLSGKRFLLILDDVWNEDYNKWVDLKKILNCGANGSKIVITTRKKKVAEIVGREQDKHPLGELSSDECWLIFKQIALSEMTNVEKELEKIGREIVNKCKGLPLAVKTMASMLRHKSSKESWESVLRSEIWTLPQSESDLVPALLLSYFDLPPHLRRCFGYCSMFPKDWEMDKREVVRMWVAQGYVVVQDGEQREMEDIGEDYFNELLGRSLFQEPRGGEYEKGNVIWCKMHDLVHDVAKYVTRCECQSFDVPGTRVVESSSSQSGDNNILHCWLSWKTEEAGFPFANWLSGGRVSGGRNLRTLILRDGPELLHLDLKIDRLQSIRVLSLFGCGISEDKLEALGELIHIRYLDLAWCNKIKSLPRSMEKLELLTYLNLSGTEIRELPEWITDLHLLRSVDLRCCNELVKLPERMYQLVGLRHLNLDGTQELESLPAMIGRLSQLRTLSRFIVAAREEEEEGRSSCSNIGELRDLNRLRGYLEISELENVGGRDDACAAKLEEKCSLTQLRLSWTMGRHTDEEVLEGLCPPTGLVRLQIQGYGGVRFAGWLDQQGEGINCSKSSISSTPSASIFSQLIELSLCKCPNVSQLPRGLGLLPRLKTLIIEGLEGVKKVGSRELLLGGGDHHAVPVPPEGFFPQLEVLRFKEMEYLEAWDIDPPLMLLTSPKVDDGNDPQVAAPMMMPLLRSLTLERCPELQALPPIFTTSLSELILSYTPLINMRFLPSQGIERIELEGMPTRTLLMESPSLPTTLKELSIADDAFLTELPVDDLLRLASLRGLFIWSCLNLETLPKEMSRLQELEVLLIEECPNLETLPEEMSRLELKDLRINGCPNLGDKCREGGLLWPNIRHIPTIYIDWTIIQRKN